jgi:xylan 1,4-beta-xylosidase
MCYTPPAMKYSNPVIPGFHPDPSVCRVGGDYYLVTSSFEFFPGVPLFHSRDLVHWRQLGHCLTRKSQLDLTGAPNSGGIYAPTIRAHEGRFYVTTTNVSGMGNFFVRTDSIEGEWSEPVPVDRKGYDPSLFFDDDGRVYFTSAGGEKPGIWQCEIDVSTGRILSDARLLWMGTGGAYPEGPHLYRIGGVYYLLISEGGTEHGHMVTIARGSSPFGPFEPCPFNPILTHRSLDLPVKAVGHADLVQAHDGSWWMVCLGIRPVPYPWRHHLGRETFLAPVEWGADGWPRVGALTSMSSPASGHPWPWAGGGGIISQEMEAGNLPEHPWPADPSRDHFDAPLLSPVWCHVRNPDEGAFSLAERPGWLRLTGSRVSLDDAGSPACVCRRQEHFNCRAETLLDFSPASDGEEAGLAVYLNEKFHYEAAVTRISGKRRVILRRRLGNLWKVEREAACPAGRVRLFIRADQERYVLGFSGSDGKKKIELGEGECSLLSTEAGGKFTGNLFCLYASGKRRTRTAPAYFDWFDYVPDREQWSLRA